MDGPRPEEGRRHDRGRERRDHAPTDGDVRLGDRRHGRGLHQGCGAEAHLSPTGLAGFVLANGSMSLSTSGEGEIRKALIEADLVAAWSRYQGTGSFGVDACGQGPATRPARASFSSTICGRSPSFWSLPPDAISSPPSPSSNLRHGRRSHRNGNRGVRTSLLLAGDR